MEEVTSIPKNTYNIELLYNSDEKWIVLPSWCHFYLNLGASVAGVCSKDKRLVVGLAMPVRSYAACLIAAGVVIARVGTICNKSFDLDEHFDDLCKLNTGTPLIYRKGNRELKGKFDGVKIFNNEKRIRIQLTSKEGGSLVELLNKEMSKAVNIIDDKVKLPKKQSGRKIVRRKTFLDSILGDITAFGFGYNSLLDCAIIGSVNVLKREMTATPIASKNHKNYVKGTFQDILRVKRFLPENRAFRTEIIPTTIKDWDKKQFELEPHVVIFDGANGYMKRRGHWHNTNTIVILDRAEPAFSEAVEIINNDFEVKRIGEDLELDLSRVPAGVEIIVYEERRR